MKRSPDRSDVSNRIKCKNIQIWNTHTIKTGNLLYSDGNFIQKEELMIMKVWISPNLFSKQFLSKQYSVNSIEAEGQLITMRITRTIEIHSVARTSVACTRFQPKIPNTSATVQLSSIGWTPELEKKANSIYTGNSINNYKNIEKRTSPSTYGAIYSGKLNGYFISEERVQQSKKKLVTCYVTIWTI